MPGAVLGAVVLDVTVSGDGQGRPDGSGTNTGIAMNKEISAAVLARLRIYQQQKDPMLGVGEMRRLHREAEKDIKSALEPLGYYSPTVEGALIEAEGVWHATYIVTPGEPVLVRSVSVEITGPGSGLSLFADLEKQFPLQDGAVLNHQQYEDGKKKILRWAIRNGFVEAGFEKNEVRVHRGNHQADIDLLLNTGHRFLFGKTSSAQQIINQDLLSRYLPYKEGEPYSLRELSQLQSILYET
ncbi:MAG: POTRA domain-containing protein, partial [Desulfocapsaceae bacterium]|nr:POTRA domain-containing protein [Desulfocapsaceae bacterium]